MQQERTARSQSRGRPCLLLLLLLVMVAPLVLVPEGTGQGRALPRLTRTERVRNEPRPPLALDSVQDPPSPSRQHLELSVSIQRVTICST